MLDEIKKQLPGRGLGSSVSEWYEKRLPTAKSPTLDQAEHILDWIAATNPPKLAKMRWDEALKSSEKWTKAEQKKGSHIVETKKDTKLFMKVDEFRIVQLIGENAFKREGHLMSHCVGSYFGKTGMKIYSLRDKQNMPHCTFEVIESGQCQQVKGKGNGPIAPKYINAVVKFLEKTGMEVRDSEMKNLGYINYEGLTDELHKDVTKTFLKGKYAPAMDTLKLKDGSTIESPLDLLDKKNLVEEVKDEKVLLKANFNIPFFVRASVELIWAKFQKMIPKEGDIKDIAASGHYAKLAASGHSAQLAASGHSAQLAASGHYAKLAASGDSAQLAASGHYAQLAASGHYAKLAASGDSAKLAASGHYAKLAASGHYAKLAASGHSAQLAASGHSAQLAASGDSAKLAASGDSAKLAASGHYAKLAASGHYAKLAASGHSAKLAASGHSAQLALDGDNSVGAAIGINNIIKAAKGSWITLAEYNTNSFPYKVICVRSAQIDGKILKANKWYKLENKEFVEVNDH